MRRIRILLTICLLGFGVTAAIIFILPLISEKEDPVCKLARERGMECVTMASPSIYERGALITSPEKANPGDALPLAKDYLLSDQCVLPGANIAFSKFHDDPKQAVAFPDQTTTVERSASALLKAKSSSKVGGLEMNAGPKINNSNKINIKSSGVQLWSIETAPLRDALGSCYVRRACVAQIRDGRARVVKDLLVAKDLRVSVSKNDEVSYPLQAAIGEGLINIDLGTQQKNSLVSELSSPSGSDMAFGARFFDPGVFADIRFCEHDLVPVKSNVSTMQQAFTQSTTNPGDNQKIELVNSDKPARAFLDLKDRKSNEGVIPAEATSASGWKLGKDTGAIEFIYTLFVEPGQRWVSIGQNGILRDPEYKEVFAQSIAGSTNNAEIMFSNRGNDLHHLYMRVMAKEESNIPMAPLQAFYSDFLQPLTVVRSDGSEQHIDAVWRRGGDDQQFDLGPLAPGEAVTLKIGYERKITAAFSADTGRLDGDVTLTFALK